MPSKYPGGYLIIDLGLNPTNRKYPGIFQKIILSKKPVIITFSGVNPLDYGSDEYVNAQRIVLDPEFEVDNVNYTFAFGTFKTDIVNGKTVLSNAILFSVDDDVTFWEA